MEVRPDLFFYQYKYQVTFKDRSTRIVTEPCARYSGTDNQNSGFVIGGSRPSPEIVDIEYAASQTRFGLKWFWCGIRWASRTSSSECSTWPTGSKEPRRFPWPKPARWLQAAGRKAAASDILAFRAMSNRRNSRTRSSSLAMIQRRCCPRCSKSPRTDPARMVGRVAASIQSDSKRELN